MMTTPQITDRGSTAIQYTGAVIIALLLAGYVYAGTRTHWFDKTEDFAAMTVAFVLSAEALAEYGKASNNYSVAIMATLKVIYRLIAIICGSTALVKLAAFN